MMTEDFHDRENGLNRLGEVYIKVKDGKAKAVVLMLEEDEFTVGTFNVNLVTAARMHAMAAEILLNQVCDVLEEAKKELDS